MKLLVRGLPADVIESNIAEGMGKLGPVISVTLYREDGAESSWAIVEMDISESRTLAIVNQVNHLWHDGRYVTINKLVR